MPLRGALTLGSAAQDLVEGLIMQLRERQVSKFRLQLALYYSTVTSERFKFDFRQSGPTLKIGTSSFTASAILAGTPLAL